MTLRTTEEIRAVGFTVKSGWAAAVLVGGAASSPRVIDSRTVELSDPSIPDSRQPYHDGFGTARESGAALSRLVESVRRFGRTSVTAVIKQYEAEGHPLSGAGMVVGSTIDPDRIANGHIRIHALEGRLFRGVMEDAAARCGLPCCIWRERDLYGAGASALQRPELELRCAISALGRSSRSPWRAEQKAAALAAWLVLATK
ncbi:MAG: hypothetical protein ACRD1H_08945 [Vicinamibacterales bacterium]